METHMKKYRQMSPERARVRTELSPKPQIRNVPVVYYLCRHRHLEHPHFIEVPLSSPEGLYLKDVIHRLNILRGKGMPATYSWSCKRSYKNGFVWHDLSEDDLIFPAHGNEYVLKGSELVEEYPPERLHQNGGIKLQKQKSSPEPASSRSQETFFSSSSIVERSYRRSQEENLSLVPSRPSSCEISPLSRIAKDKDPSWNGSLSSTEYKVCKADRAADASTQTDDRERRSRNRDPCTRGVSTDELSDMDYHENRRSRVPQKHNAEVSLEEISPPPSSSSTSSVGKTETLESLIKADVNKINSFRILEEEQVRVPSLTKLKASNVLMQLISCGSITVKDHHGFGFIPSYRPRFMRTSFASPMFSGSMILGELDCFSENPRLMGMTLEDKEYFSGSLIETKKHKEGEGEAYPVLKRSSSYNADRTCRSSETTEYREKKEDSVRSSCIPRTIKGSNKHLRNEPSRSPLSEATRVSSEELACLQGMPATGDCKRITDPSNVKRSSKRLVTGKEEKLIKIEENLLQELGL